MSRLRTALLSFDTPVEDQTVDPSVDPVIDAELPTEDDVLFDTSAELPGVELDGTVEVLDATDDASDLLAEDLATDVETVTAMEALVHYLKGELAAGRVTRQTAIMANCAFESYCVNARLKPTMAFAMESLERDPETAVKEAMESIAEKAKSLWNSVKARTAELSKKIGEKVALLTRGMEGAQARLNAVEEKLGKVDLSAQPKAPLVKPRKSFINLLYVSKGVPQGLKGIAADVNHLLQEHASIASKSVSFYSDWLEKNYDQAATNPEVFNTLVYNPAAFLMKGSTPFAARLERLAASEGTKYFRSRELPGGMAVFTQVMEGGTLKGIEAVNALGTVEYHFSPYEPAEYKELNKLTQALVGVGLITWLAICAYYGFGFGAAAGSIVGAAAGGTAGAVLGAPVGAAGLTGAAGAAVGAAAGMVKGGVAGVKAGAKFAMKNNPLAGVGRISKENLPKLDKKLQLETLSGEEIKRASGEVRQILQSIEQWKKVVFTDIWRNRNVDKILTDLIESDGVYDAEGDELDGPGAHALKNYCYNLLNLMDAHSQSFHTYALSVAHAMIDVLDTSVAQYSRAGAEAGAEAPAGDAAAAAA